MHFAKENTCVSVLKNYGEWIHKLMCTGTKNYVAISGYSDLLFVIVCFPLLRFQDTLCCDNGPIPVLSSILRAPAMGVLFLRHSSGYLFNATMCPIIKQSLYKSLQHIVRHCP